MSLEARLAFSSPVLFPIPPQALPSEDSRPGQLLGAEEVSFPTGPASEPEA